MIKKKTDYMIKVGGSLMNQSNEFNDLIDCLEHIGQKHNLVITTGSKALSNVMMDYITDNLGIKFNMNTRFDVIMKARDAMARVFSDYKKSFVYTETLEGVNDAFSKKLIPVLLQHTLLMKDNPFVIEKGLSTDTTSALFAKKLGLESIIKLTNVDGVFKKIESDLLPIKNLGVQELKTMGKTCIDTKLANLLEKEKLNCYVMNGYNTDNLLNFINGKDSIYTKVHY